MSAGESPGSERPGAERPGARPLRADRPRRRWPRVLLVLVLLRLLLWAVQAPLLRAAAGSFGMRSELADVSLALSTGRLEVRGLRLWPAESEPAADAIAERPAGALQYALVDVDLGALLRGALHVERVDLDGLDVVLRRAAPQTAVAASTATAEPSPPASRGAPASPPRTPPGSAAQAPADTLPSRPDGAELPELSLALPFAVDELRVQHARLFVSDGAVTPPLETTLELDLRLTDLGAAGAPAQLLLRATARDVLDELRLEGRLAGDALRQDAALTLEIRGLHPGPLAGHLRGAGLAPHAGALELRASLAATATLVGARHERCEARLQLTELALSADRETALSLDRLLLEGTALTAQRHDWSTLELSGLHARAQRLDSGVLRVAGLDILPAGAVVEEAGEVAADAAVTREPEAAEDAAEPATPWSLARLAVRDVRFLWQDAAVVPAAELPLQLAELTLGPLRSDATAETPLATLAATLHAPGLAERLTLGGTLGLSAARTSAELQLDVTGLAPEGAAAYLRGAGLESTLRAGALSLQLRAESTTDDLGGRVASARLSDVLLRDGESTLAALQHVTVSAVTLAPDGSRVEFGDVDITGPELALRRDAHGALHLLGLRTLTPEELPRGAAAAGDAAPVASAPAAVPAASAATSAASPSQPAAPAPRLRLGRLGWHDLAVHVVDESVVPPIDLQLEDFGVELTELALGGDPASGALASGSVRAWVGLPGSLGRAELAGTLTSRPGPLDLETQLALELVGLEGGAAARWLAAAGLETRWQDGRVALALEGSLRQQSDSLSARLVLRDVQVENAGERWLSLQRLEVAPAEFRPDGMHLPSVELTGLAVRAARDAQGGLLFAGLRLPPAEPSRSDGAEEPEGASAGAGAPSPPFRVQLDVLRLEEVSWAFADAAVVPAADVRATLSGQLTEFDTGAGAARPAPARFNLTLAVADALARGTVHGLLRLTPNEQQLNVDLDLRGLRAGPLAGYVPPGAVCELRDGRLNLALTAQRARAAEGGERLSLELRRVAYHDAAAPAGREPLLALERFAVVAPRVDLAGGVVDVEELTLTGWTLDASRSAPGTLHLLGFAFGGAPEALPLAVSAAEDSPTEADAQDARGASVAVRTEPAEARGAGLGKATPLPRVTLRRLDVGLERLTWRDATQSDAAPHEAVPRVAAPRVAAPHEAAPHEAAPLIASLRLSAGAPLVLLDREPEDLPPWELSLQASAQPLLEALLLDLRVAPFTSRPSLDLVLRGSGLQGSGLPALLPELRATLDGSELVDATLAAELRAELLWPRRGPVDFDLSHGFGAQVQLDGLELRAGADGERLAGLDGLDLDVARFSPATGALHVRSLSLDTPRALIVSREDGWRVLGLRLLPSPESGAAPGGAATGAAATGAAAGGAAAGGGPGAAPLRVDSLTVSGLDLQFRDETLTPPLLLPINALDAELTGLDTAPTATRSMRFGVFLGAGEVPLPRPVKASSLLAGVARAAVSSMTGSSEAPQELEPRHVFEEVALVGRLSNGPTPQGWAQLHIAGLELMAFASAARRAGVIVGDGVLDGSVEAQLRGADDLVLDSSLTFTDLALSEPANGPISQYLKLPAPLDTVVFLLRNEVGQIRIDLNLGGGGVSPTELAQEAVSTLGALITRAVAASPLRVTGTLTDTLGITGGGAALVQETPVTLSFAPGETALSPAEGAALAALLQRLEADDELTLVLEHHFGGGDIAQAAALANPAAADSLEVAARLRQERSRLARQRDELAADVRAFLAVGRPEEAAALTQQLHDMDHDYGLLEQGLDSVLETLRPGAERRADQRTRAACLAVARQRLDVVARALRQGGDEQVASRIEVRPPRWQAAEGPDGGSVQLALKHRPPPKGLFSRFFGWLWPF